LFDVILLDEAQDYLPGELKLFRRLAHDIFMVADLRQQIYPGESVKELLEGMVDKVLPLHLHYRSGQPICDVADRIGNTFAMGYDPILPTCNYNSPELRPSVEVFEGEIQAQAEEDRTKACATTPYLSRGVIGGDLPTSRRGSYHSGDITADGVGSGALHPG
jgi:hypothetical protein